MKRRMRKKIYCVIALCLAAPFLLPSNSWAAKKSKGGKMIITAKSAIFADSSRAKPLYGKDIDNRVPPASTLKVMTALLVLEKISLDKVVTVSRQATYPQPSKINARIGEQYKVSSLLYAVLLKSANDASIVLAEAVAGSEDNFVDMMNQRARRLGCKNTKFANSHGLPDTDSQYTTAYDMYLIFKEALKYPFFRQAIQCRYKTIYSEEGRKIGLTSHNDILFSKWKQKIYGKTGYTRSAKACFVGYLQKDGRDFIIAVLGCKSKCRWKEIKYIVSTYGGISL
ncbi:MAG: D-alanyl-D-alanine carboxypeptidase [Candidatus Omnitrophica bacterium]|nr:D-alanyl-D-alanine carboxypeptidase [Candidatus Omnitrophota bacterium]